ncbi:MAG: metallophosphoesterase [Clostridia bacterium]
MQTVTRYQCHTGKLARPLVFAVVSDLHDEPFTHLFSMMEGADALLVPGDISSRYRQTFQQGLAFLTEAAKRLPTFFSMGNHEIRQKQYKELRGALEQTGANVLVNRYLRFADCWIGGWYSPKIVGVPDMLEEFSAQEGCKVLLCHKPEDYFKHVRAHEIDLVVAGHAHGGQIRIGGRGLYAPGQGFFPKYTHGMADGHLIISAGASNPVSVPRWGNPCEILLITLD